MAPKPLMGGVGGGGRGDGLVIMPQVPAPKHITEVELKVLSSCLTRSVSCFDGKIINGLLLPVTF